MSDGAPSSSVPPVRSRSNWRGWKLAVSLALIAITLWSAWHWWHQVPLNELPEIDLSQASPAVRQAIDQARATVIRRPRSGPAWGRLGMTLLAHDLVVPARTCLAMAERFDGREARWPYLAGISLAIEDPRAAIDGLRRAARMAPGEALPLLRIGELLLELGRIDEADSAFREALGRRQKSPRALLGLARAALARGNIVESRRLAEESIDLDPQKRSAHELLLQACHRLGDKEGIACERRVLQDLPMGETTWDDHFVAEAIELRRDPLWMARRADELLSAGRTRDAIRFLGNLERADLDNPQWSIKLARAHLANRDDSSARKTVDEALQRHVESVELWFQSGVIAFLTGDGAGAERAFREAIRLRPGSGDAWYNLGHTLRRMHRTEEALSAFREAARVQPALAGAHANVAELLMNSGQYDEALAHLRAAVELAPSDATPRRMLEAAESP